MCDWSNWQFICERRYDSLLAILAGVLAGNARSSRVCR